MSVIGATEEQDIYTALCCVQLCHKKGQLCPKHACRQVMVPYQPQVLFSIQDSRVVHKLHSGMAERKQSVHLCLFSPDRGVSDCLLWCKLNQVDFKPSVSVLQLLTHKIYRLKSCDHDGLIDSSCFLMLRNRFVEPNQSASLFPISSTHQEGFQDFIKL